MINIMTSKHHHQRYYLSSLLYR